MHVYFSPSYYRHIYSLIPGNSATRNFKIARFLEILIFKLFNQSTVLSAALLDTL